MTRTCLVIGVTEYCDDRLLPIPSATRDAQQIFDTLCTGEYASYDARLSKCLINPTQAEVLEALGSTLLETRSEVFTFYFAGHGALVSGTFYMCMKDTNSNQYSRSSLSFTQLLAILNEKTPQQANVIIDACQAGGIAFGIGQAINPELLGTHECNSLSLFASASSDQYAHEDDSGGYATRKLLDILNGRTPMESTDKFLDLVNVGYRVCQTIETSPDKQAPVLWGLSLSGVSQFAKNPNGDSTSSLSAHTVTATAAASTIGAKLVNRREALWRLYLELGNDIDLRGIYTEISQSARLLDPTTSEVSRFVLGLSQTLPVRAAASGDGFAASQVLACCATVLLEFANTDSEAKETIGEIARRFAEETQKQLEQLRESLAEGDHVLLSRSGLTSQLILLPMRLSVLLGYIGAVDIICSELRLDSSASKVTAKFLIEELIARFAPSFACVADSQASYLALYFASDLAVVQQPVSAHLCSLYLADFWLKKGQILRQAFTGSDALTYALSRKEEPSQPPLEIIARPTETLPLLLLLADRYGLHDVTDPYLGDFDHQEGVVFIPKTLQSLWQRRIEQGLNVCLRVGATNPTGFFTVEEFASAFASLCKPLLRKHGETDAAIRVGAILSVLVHSNRVYWHLLSD